jgi:hypothetical protein
MILHTSGSVSKNDDERKPLEHHSARAEVIWRILRGIPGDLIDCAVELVQKSLRRSPASLCTNQ